VGQYSMQFNSWNLFEGALASSKKNMKLKLGSDWGHRISQDGEIDVPCIGVDDLLENQFASNSMPFILKIDIEGGENDVFSQENSWLEKFPLLIIEPHDWMLPFSGSSRSFMKAVVRFDFDIVMHGENIFFFNRKLLQGFIDV
jgi:hypothetical protein